MIALRVGEDLIEEMFEIRQEVVKHFTDIYKESNVGKPRLEGVVFALFQKIITLF